MRYRFVTADVFTDRVFGGNQLAVLPDARGLDAPLMQAIAREFNLSETAFVFPPDDPRHTRRLRIFTPGGELPFAGHPTVGTAHVLAAIGELRLAGPRTDVVFEEGVGPVPVSIRTDGGRVVHCELASARLPAVGPPPPTRARLAAVLGIGPEELAPDRDPLAVSCGVPFLFVAVRDAAVLARVRLDRQRWRETLADYWAPHLYVVALDPSRPDRVRARMFAPALGIPEDPATSAAAAALAGYLDRQGGGPGETLRWTVEQGVEMGRPSRLQVEAERRGEAIAAVRVGGSSVMVSEGYLEL
ncbi:MAG TPA: PhzF family phenazine biosynthesis protein [Gemmatimonadales bacterium]|nr:PhzF family phenazine biosynthesis protein [Gemmatimonadales bacterium]